MNEVAAYELPPAATDHPTRTLSPAAAKLVEEHLSLIPALTAGMAAHYPRHADREELAQAAALGLVEAALRYDPTRGVPFERWAAARVRGAVVDAIRAIDFAPRSVRSRARHIDSALEALSQNLGRTPTTEELAANLQMSARELDAHRARRETARVLSLDAPTGSAEGSGSGLADVLVELDGPTPESVVDEAESLALLGAALRLLPDRLRAVIDGYFIAGRTSLELADELGVTESRIAQMRAEGLAMMRMALAEPMQRVPAGEGQVGRRAARSREQYVAAVADEAASLARGGRGCAVAATAADGTAVTVSIPRQRRESPRADSVPAPRRTAA
ncbi:MAG TPA: sigma-70 family RNA polymerase sigma factor [Mycobacteriales bacterium]|nr:sigma-70 family RNA polymerase sigma factor [Mycobacteriales bacterium]